jgi:FkbM family methyltransferase
VKKRSKKKTKKRLHRVRKKELQQQISSADIQQNTEAQPTLELAEQEMAPILEGSDEDTLARAKTHWFFGEWQQLAALDIDSLHAHPDRDRFALLIASAHQQLGEHEKAHAYTRMSLNWGCPPQVVAQVLIAGVHNTLGRAAALNQDESRIAHHFEASVAAISTKDTALVSHARSVREMARMGLLPQAATLVDKQLQVTHNQPQKSLQQEAHYKVLQTEVELLSHELSLAQQRQQIFSTPTGNNHTESDFDPNDPAQLERLKKCAVSQLGQDLWVLKQTNYKKNGFFVEFGATDGVLLSNTWLLEKKFRWNGICAEPNPKFIDKLKRNRSCIVSNACIGATTGEKIEFVFADAYGGMKKHINIDNNAHRRAGYADLHDTNVIIETISLHDFLLQHNAPRVIDYLSIDTEGSELDILETFPFGEWEIRILTVEHNFTEQRAKIKSLMEHNGYHCKEMQWDDWFSKKP